MLRERRSLLRILRKGASLRDDRIAKVLLGLWLRRDTEELYNCRSKRHLPSEVVSWRCKTMEVSNNPVDHKTSREVVMRAADRSSPCCCLAKCSRESVKEDKMGHTVAFHWAAGPADSLNQTKERYLKAPSMPGTRLDHSSEGSQDCTARPSPAVALAHRRRNPQT